MYSGEYLDKETQTYYLRARYYDPAIGRFITEDSYWGMAGDPLSLNLYIYCSNNPIIFIDPSGNQTIQEIEADMLTQYDSAYQGYVASLETDDKYSDDYISYLSMIEISSTNTGPTARFESQDAAAIDFVRNSSQITYTENRETGTYIIEIKTETETYYTYNESHPGGHNNVIANAVGEFLAYAYLNAKRSLTDIEIGEPVAFVHTHPHCPIHDGVNFSKADIFLYNITGIRTIYLGTTDGRVRAYEGKPNYIRDVSALMPKPKVIFPDCDIRK